MAILGIQFPFQSGVSQFPAPAVDNDAIESSVVQILMTQPGERCLHGDTHISLLDGRKIKISDLVDVGDFWVYSFDIIKKILVPGKARAVKTDIVNELLEIELDNGEIIRCTNNHKFLLKNLVYKEASELIIGESLLPIYTKIRKIVSIKSIKLDQPGQMYDLNVDKYHNFALTSGVFVHNCMRPTFGCNLLQFIFNSDSDQNTAAIVREVKTALAKWEPRITVTSVTTQSDPVTEPGQLLIAVSYVVNANGNSNTITVGL